MPALILRVMLFSFWTHSERVFNSSAPILASALAKIAALELGALAKRVQKEKNITLEIGAGIAEYIAKKSQNPNEGARLVKRTISEKIEYPIASLIVSGKAKQGDVIGIKIIRNKIVIS